MSSHPRAPKVLLVAEAANPDWSSVPLVGWSLCQALAQVTDAHVVTQKRNGEAITRAGWREGVEFTSIDSEAAAAPMWKFDAWLRKLTGLGWTTTSALAAIPYYYFEHLLWRRFGERIRAHEFDLVHRITPLSPTIPSLLAAHCHKADVPFVLGPLNGGVPWPAEYDDLRRKEGEWLSYVRDAYKLLPGYRSSRKFASAIVVGSKATHEQLNPQGRARAVYMPENAIDPARFNASVSAKPGSPLRVAFVGRLVPYKGADILLDAAAPLLRDGRLHLDIIGDGPDRGLLEQKIKALGVDQAVLLDGWVEHRELQHRLARADIFAFPSIREFGGGVVLEAMALGLVPIVVDYAGPAELVTDETGFRIPLGNRQQLVERFRDALIRTTEAPEGLRQRGQRARQRVLTHFTWAAKAQQLLQVYDWVLGRSERPDFRPLYWETPVP